MPPPEGDSSAGQHGEQASLLTTDVRGIPCFNPREDPTNLAVRWKRWKRSFNLYLTAKGVTSDKQKVALLLHTAGLELQELHYTLVNEDEDKTFADCVKVLDDYFVPKVNLPFERHQFRQMSQGPGEKFDQFVSRLRQKAASCEFTDVDEAIRDQLIEKCLDSKLRRKFLEKANATLKDLQDVARAHEAVDEQMRSMESSSHSVNALDHKPRSTGHGKGSYANRNRKPASKGHGNKDTKQRCYNCNKPEHFARDSVCPARNQNCNECGVKGHFSACCRGKQTEKGGKKKSKAYQVSEDNGRAESDGYAFVVDQLEPKNAGEVNLIIGGVKLEGVLIDSGATCNLIDYKIWDYLKEKRVKCESRKSDKKLFAYGQKEPIDVAGTFVTEIECEANGEKCVDAYCSAGSEAAVRSQG